MQKGVSLVGTGKNINDCKRRHTHEDVEFHIEFEEEFHKVCGDILISCMEKGLRKEDEVDIIYRDSNSESLVDERKLYKESLTISEE